MCDGGSSSQSIFKLHNSLIINFRQIVAGSGNGWKKRATVDSTVLIVHFDAHSVIGKAKISPKRKRKRQNVIEKQRLGFGDILGDNFAFPTQILTQIESIRDLGVPMQCDPIVGRRKALTRA